MLSFPTECKNSHLCIKTFKLSSQQSFGGSTRLVEDSFPD